MKKIFSFILALMASVGTMFASTKVGGIWYNFDSSYKIATVTYRGSSPSSYANEYSGDVIIPAFVIYNNVTYNVTSIGDGAFVGCCGLTSVTIPTSVTSIGYNAFYGCSGLTSVTIPTSVTSIGSSAFSGCTGLTSVTIPTSVTSIEDHVFFGCTGLTSVTIPNSVISIGNDAFSDCSGLTSVTIPNSVTRIGSSAFEGCTSLTSITIPSSVTSIGYYAFFGCSNLTSIKVEPGNTTYDSRDNCNAIILTADNSLIAGCMNTTIPNSVTSIGWSAFTGCTGLTSITIPNSVTSIEENAFRGCTGLTSIKVEPGNTTYDSRDNCNAIILTADNSLIAGCMNTTIPNSVTSIGSSAFSGCTGLTSVTIPTSVTSIGGNAFWGCTGLTSITIGNSVTSIRNEAFSGCTGLTSITIPNSVTSIGFSAFSGCLNLKSVTINSNRIADHLGSNGFKKTHELFGPQVTEYIIGDSVNVIGRNAFEGCSNLKKVIISNNVTVIGYRAFKDCIGLTDVVIPCGTIGVDAFKNCQGLTNITLGDSVERIRDAAFMNCYRLSFVTIPDGVIYIGDSAFYNCGLKNVGIGQNVYRIGAYAFERNPLKNIDISLCNNVGYVKENAFPSTVSILKFPNACCGLDLRLYDAYSLHPKYDEIYFESFEYRSVSARVVHLYDVSYIIHSGVITYPFEYVDTLYVPKENVYVMREEWQGKNVKVILPLPKEDLICEYLDNADNEYSVLMGLLADSTYDNDGIYRQKADSILSVINEASAVAISASASKDDLRQASGNLLQCISEIDSMVFEIYKIQAIDSCQSLAQNPEYEACVKIITQAQNEIQELVYNKNINLDQNQKAINAIISKLLKDLNSPCEEDDESIDDIRTDLTEPRKILRDGQIYIIRGERTYTPAGQKVKNLQ